MVSMLIYYAPVPGDPSRLAVVATRDSRVLPLWVANERGLTVLEAIRDGEPARNDDDEVVVVADFAAHEAAGKPLRDYGEDALATGATTWPEWLRSEDLARMDVELEPGWARTRAREERPDHALRALVHRESGYRRERVALEHAIDRRIEDEAKAAHDAGEALRAALIAEGVQPEPVLAFVNDPEPAPADCRDLVGGPSRPLILDAEGRSTGRRRTRGPG